MKRIYFVQNKDDEASFFEFLRSLEDDISPYISSFANKKRTYTKTNFADMLSENRQERYIYFKERSDEATILCEEDLPMKIVMPNQRHYHWMLGYVILYADTVAKTPESAAFRKIAKYIKKEYVLSSDRGYHIGPGVYNDWLNYKVDCQLRFSYQSIRVDKSKFNFDAFRKYVEVRGYIVKGDDPDIKGDPQVYVIFSPDCLLKSMPGAQEGWYTPNSQCVFLHIWRPKIMEFVIDDRLLSGSCEEIVKLKNYILEFLSTPET